jgi:hypothetical protein
MYGLPSKLITEQMLLQNYQRNYIPLPMQLSTVSLRLSYFILMDYKLLMLYLSDLRLRLLRSP